MSEEVFCERCGAEMEMIVDGEVCDTCRHELAKKWMKLLDKNTETHTKRKEIWECQNCEHRFSMDSMPYDCPNCDYHHCGDMTCCTGEGFIVTDEDTKPGKKSASPTSGDALDWLLILPSAHPKESTLDMAMYFESEFPPPLIERREKHYRLKTWTGAGKGKGTARYRAVYSTREGEVYRQWSDLKKATGKEVDALIETWKEEFGDVIDLAMGQEGVTSTILDGEGRELRAGGWLNRDMYGDYDYLKWTVTGIVSDKVGLRYVNVWRNNYPSENKGAYGWEVRMGGAQLGVHGGVGMEKLVGYSKDLDTAKTDGMTALLEVNRVVEAEGEKRKKIKEMVSAPMMPSIEHCAHGAMFNPNCTHCVAHKNFHGEAGMPRICDRCSKVGLEEGLCLPCARARQNWFQKRPESKASTRTMNAYVAKLEKKQ